MHIVRSVQQCRWKDSACPYRNVECIYSTMPPKLGIKELWWHDYLGKRIKPSTVALALDWTWYCLLVTTRNWLNLVLFISYHKEFCFAALRVLFMSLFHMHCQSAYEASLMSRPGGIPLVFVDRMSDQVSYYKLELEYQTARTWHQWTLLNLFCVSFKAYLTED
jgi:hypothetical protein